MHAVSLRSGTGSLEELQHIVDHAAHLLPAQGPIPVFIHHNTLHAFEHLTFSEAVAQGSELFGCQPYLSEDRYREEMARGRIRYEGLDESLREDLADAAEQEIALGCTRFQLRRAMLLAPLRSGTTEELHWFVAETDALRRVAPHLSASDRAHLVAETRRWALRDLRGQADRPGAVAVGALAEIFDRFGNRHIETWGPDAWESFGLQVMWRICRSGVADVPQFAKSPALPIRHRDLLRRVAGADSDLLVHDVLIRFCAAFLDQGLGHWAMPHRDTGIFRAFGTLYQQPGGPPYHWRRGLAEELKRIEAAGIDPLQSLLESLTLLGVPTDEWDAYISATLLALRGWAGIIHFLEERPDRSVHSPPKGSLIEYLAIRLILERLALAHLARSSFGYTGPLDGLRRTALMSQAVSTPRFGAARVLALSARPVAGLDSGRAVATRAGRVGIALARSGKLLGPRATKGFPSRLRTAILHSLTRRHCPARQRASADAAAGTLSGDLLHRRTGRVDPPAS